ncbi:hypothetical protein F5Y16DRAFT_406943 [Xylariaceae sp. FL0255]|nr:hypothetical protein F5Y16DRAFT_406943 [Xylariaceae sp. FL0255]
MTRPQLHTRIGKAASISLNNRQKGIFKKSNTLRRMYGGEVAVLIEQQDGLVVTYESKPGILKNASFLFLYLSYSPDDFDTIKDRQCTPRLSPTAIPLITMQFFDTEAMTGDPSIGKICDEYTNGPSATPTDNIALIQAPATNNLD